MSPTGESQQIFDSNGPGTQYGGLPRVPRKIAESNSRAGKDLRSRQLFAIGLEESIRASGCSALVFNLAFGKNMQTCLFSPSVIQPGTIVDSSHSKNIKQSRRRDEYDASRQPCCRGVQNAGANSHTSLQ